MSNITVQFFGLVINTCSLITLIWVIANIKINIKFNSDISIGSPINQDSQFDIASQSQCKLCMSMKYLSTSKCKSIIINWKNL